MKYSSLFLAILLYVLASCSGSEARERLAAEVEATSAILPQNLGANGVWESISYCKSDNRLTLEYNLDHTYVSADAIRSASASQKHNMGAFLQGESGRQMLGLLDGAGASMRIIYKFPSEDDQVDFDFTAAEIHDLAAEVAVRDAEVLRLETMVRNDSIRCPADLGEGVVLTAVSIEGRYMVNALTVPDSIFPRNSQAMQDYRDSTMARLARSGTDNPGLREALRTLRRADYGLRYRISAAAPDSASFVMDISPAQLAEME